MSTSPIHALNVGDPVEVFQGGGWIRGTLVTKPVDGEHTYRVYIGEGIQYARPTAFELRPYQPNPNAIVREERPTVEADPIAKLEIGQGARCGHCSQTIRPGMAGHADHLEGCLIEPIVISVAEKHARAFLEQHVPGDIDPETPVRMSKAFDELTEGYGADFQAILKTFPRGDADSGIVIVRDIPFASVCEHHVLPFTGTASVAYLPSDRIVGLSKIPRLVRAVTRRLQVQERIGAMVADALTEHVGARGVMVVLKSRHTCMTLRGVECPGEMVTSTIRGAFEDHAARAEVLALINSR